MVDVCIVFIIFHHCQPPHHLFQLLGSPLLNILWNSPNPNHCPNPILLVDYYDCLCLSFCRFHLYPLLLSITTPSCSTIRITLRTALWSQSTPNTSLNPNPNPNHYLNPILLVRLLGLPLLVVLWSLSNPNPNPCPNPPCPNPNPNLNPILLVRLLGLPLLVVLWSQSNPNPNPNLNHTSLSTIRIAFACRSVEPIHAAIVAAKEKVQTPPLRLPTPGDQTDYPPL